MRLQVEKIDNTEKLMNKTHRSAQPPWMINKNKNLYKGAASLSICHVTSRFVGTERQTHTFWFNEIMIVTY